MIFRAFTSVPRSIESPDGRPVNGIYGLIGTLLRLIRDHRPSHLLVAFDVPETPTFRHELYPRYQGQRGPLGGVDAENFAWQVQQAKTVLTTVGIQWLVAPGYEADDIIGTMSQSTAVAGLPTIIVSSDRDLQQLITPTVRVLIPGKKPLIVGESEVKERLGITPHQIVDWKVLAGDPSDNIPGIAGIGDKSAVALVEQHGGWRDVYDHLEEVAPRLRRALGDGRTDAELFEDLVRIRCDLPIEIEVSGLQLAIESMPVRAGDALRLAGLRREE